MSETENGSPQPPLLPDLAQVEAFRNVLRRILVHSDRALEAGDAHLMVDKIEKWTESYRRGLEAAQKISDSGLEMLQEARTHLSLARDDLLRLEGEGGTPPNKEHVNDTEEISKAISYIDKLVPLVGNSFPITVDESKTS